MNAVTSRFGADVDYRVADPRCLAVEDLILFEDPQRKSIHQRIARVGLFENDFAANRGHSETIAVTGDPRNHTFHDAAVLHLLQRPKSQGIHSSDWACSHGEDVA